MEVEIGRVCGGRLGNKILPSTTASEGERPVAANLQTENVASASSEGKFQ